MQMAFKQDGPQRKLEDSILAYLGVLKEDFVQSWEEHQATIAMEDEELTYGEHIDAAGERDDQVTINGLDLNSLTRIGKLGVVIDDTLDKLATGEMRVSNGEELLATTQSVAILEQLYAGLHSD